MKAFAKYDLTSWLVDGLTQHHAPVQDAPPTVNLFRRSRKVAVAIAVAAAAVGAVDFVRSVTASQLELQVSQRAQLSSAADVIRNPAEYWARVSQRMSTWKAVEESPLPMPPPLI